MKRVLVITDLLQASPRFPGIANYLPEHGWEVTVVTPPVDRSSPHFGGPHDGLRIAAQVVQTPSYKQKPDRLHDMARAISKERDLRSPIWKLGRAAYGGLRRLRELLVDQFLWFPDAEKHWRRPALVTARRLLASRRFDAILSSSSPVTSHLIAAVLQQESGLPWVADLRDLWTQNAVYRFSRARRLVERRLEVATFKDAAALLTVSQPLVEELRTLHGDARIAELRNGFDPRWYVGSGPPLTEEFTITYTGQVYAGKQNPGLILQALHDLIAEGGVARDAVRVRFYGPAELSIDWEAKRLALADIVEQYGVVPRRVAVERQRESQLLLVFNWEDTGQRGGIILQKTFDYVGARRPMLATGGHHGDLREDLIRRGRCGSYCPTLADVKKALLSYFQEYRERGAVAYGGRDEVVAECSYPQRAAVLAGELDLVTAGRG